MATLILEDIFMKAIAKKAYESYSSLCSAVHTKTMSLINLHASKILLVIGACLLTVGLTQVAQAQWDSEILGALNRIFGIIEGSFGALVMVVAGLAAIIAAAMGAYKASLGCLVVAVGAFILRSMVKLFFGDVVTDIDGSTRGDSEYTGGLY